MAVVNVTRNRVSDLLRSLSHLLTLPEKPTIIVVGSGLP